MKDQKNNRFNFQNNINVLNGINKEDDSTHEDVVLETNEVFPQEDGSDRTSELFETGTDADGVDFVVMKIGDEVTFLYTNGAQEVGNDYDFTDEQKERWDLVKSRDDQIHNWDSIKYKKARYVNLLKIDVRNALKKDKKLWKRLKGFLNIRSASVRRYIQSYVTEYFHKRQILEHVYRNSFSRDAYFQTVSDQTYSGRLANEVYDILEMNWSNFDYNSYIHDAYVDGDIMIRKLDYDRYFFGTDLSGFRVGVTFEVYTREDVVIKNHYNSLFRDQDSKMNSIDFFPDADLVHTEFSELRAA